MLAPHPTFANRQALLRALRDPEATQCKHTYGEWEKPHGPVCYAGMAMRVFRAREGSHDPMAQYPAFCSYFGVDLLHFPYIASLNDQGKTFSELADLLENTPLLLETTS